MDVKALPDINTPRSPLLPTKEYFQSLALEKAGRGNGTGPEVPAGDEASAARAAARVDRPLYIGDGPPPASPHDMRAADTGTGTTATAVAGAGAAAGAGASAAPPPAASGAASPSVDPEAWVREQLRTPTVEQVRQYWIDRQVGRAAAEAGLELWACVWPRCCAHTLTGVMVQMEVVCLVEGIDGVTSDTTQVCVCA